MSLETPAPHDSLDLTMGDGAVIRVRRYALAGAARLFLSNGNGFAIDGYYPFWGPLAERFELIAFDMRNHGRNPPASSGRDGHTYAQMALDLERVVRLVGQRFGRRPSVGVFHSMSARTAMKHAIEIGFPWKALILFDPPNVPPPGHRYYEVMDVFEHRLAEWATGRQERFTDPAELWRARTS
jgi:pimeloyl-ACP methyl ester carboxylesterase